jgi:small neutral amino acid transporter SnatA (MarC family)
MITLPHIKLFIDCTLAFLALINPVSKIFIMSTLLEKMDYQTWSRFVRFIWSISSTRSVLSSCST